MELRTISKVDISQQMNLNAIRYMGVYCPDDVQCVYASKLVTVIENNDINLSHYQLSQYSKKNGHVNPLDHSIDDDNLHNLIWGVTGFPRR